MIDIIFKNKLMKTKSLEAAINLVFNKVSTSRNCIFTQEEMIGNVAKEYNNLGRNSRQETYKKLAGDFKMRTGCYGVNHLSTSLKVGSILEVGCGSGLLILELAEQTNGNIVGLDLSKDMITLAKDNLTKRFQKRIEEIKEFWGKIPEYCKPGAEDYKKLHESPPLLDGIRYVRGSVYDLQDLGLQNVNYVVCRNALHRFQYPEKAINQIYNILSPGGKIYIRDLRRDANWQTILDRIGEKRWNTQTLVQDYIGAMASMLTTLELESTLQSLGIKHFDITDGRYINGEIKNLENIKEFEKEIEYVCVIRKENSN